MTAEFDYVVVGGGGAGAVLARMLAERGRSRVALIEAGPSDEDREEVLDLRRCEEVTDGPLSRKIPIVAPKAGNGRFVYPIARVLGGCTSHNTCIWFRPPDSDFDDWEAAGAKGWSPASVNACFDALEARVRIEIVDPKAQAHRALLSAAEELNYPLIDFSKPFDAGIGRYRMNKIGARRQSSSVVYLHPLSALPGNLTVFTETEVERLIFGEANDVLGVATNRGGFHARREVVLCAGAFDTPRLMLHSGIGPAEELRAFGIPVRSNLPGVGAHLLDHPASCVNINAARAPQRLDPWNYAGVLFARVENDAVWPDIEIQLGPELFERQTLPAGYPSSPHGFSAYFTVNRARSEGRMRLASPDPRLALAVEPAYFTDPDGYDLKIMAGGLRIARRLFATRAMFEWVHDELAPGAGCQTDDQIADFVRETAMTGYHPAGTCRMGDPAHPTSVVAPDLRVIGVRNLRIADASIFPSMVSVNIAPTCMMIGLRAAEIISGDR